MTEQGIQEAKQAGKTLLQEGIEPQMCFTSYLKRAIKTLNNILDAMNMDYLPVEKSWRLNEKSYGDLQGKNKTEATEKFGDEQVCRAVVNVLGFADLLNDTEFHNDDHIGDAHCFFLVVRNENGCDIGFSLDTSDFFTSLKS